MVADLVFLIHLQSLEECVLERSQLWIHVYHIAGCEEQGLSAIGCEASSYIFALRTIFTTFFFSFFFFSICQRLHICYILCTWHSFHLHHLPKPFPDTEKHYPLFPLICKRLMREWTERYLGKALMGWNSYMSNQGCPGLIMSCLSFWRMTC